MNAKNSLSLRAYSNFQGYKKAMELSKKSNASAKDTVTSMSNGLLSRRKMMQSKPVNNTKYKELEKVDYYVNLVKDIVNGEA
jgi:hypothetical protein